MRRIGGGGWRKQKEHLVFFPIAVVIMIALLLTYHWTEAHWLAELIVTHVEVNLERKKGVVCCCRMSLGRIWILLKPPCSLWVIQEGLFFTWVLVLALGEVCKQTCMIRRLIWSWFDPQWKIMGKLGFLFLNGLWKQIQNQQLPRWKVYHC